MHAVATAARIVRSLSIGPRDGWWTRVAADHPSADKPRWAPDGRTIYFLSRRLSSYLNLWGIRFDPVSGVPVGAPYALTSFDSPRMMISPHIDRAETAISASYAVLTMTSVSGSIWMVDK